MPQPSDVEIASPVDGLIAVQREEVVEISSPLDGLIILESKGPSNFHYGVRDRYNVELRCSTIELPGCAAPLLRVIFDSLWELTDDLAMFRLASRKEVELWLDNPRVFAEIIRRCRRSLLGYGVQAPICSRQPAHLLVAA